MSGFDLRKILLPNVSHPHLGWVSKNVRLEPRDPRLDQLQVLVSRLSPSNGSWNCRWNYETLTVNNINPQKKWRSKKHQIREMDFFILLCIFVSLRLSVFMLTCSMKKYRSTRLNTAAIVRPFYIDHHDSTSCYCAPAGVSETTSWRNWSTNCNRLHGIPYKGTRFYVQ